MKDLSIKWRILITALLPATVLALALGAFFIKARIDEVTASLRDRVQAIARQLAPASEYGVFTGNRDQLKWLVDSAKHEADVSLVTISNIEGQVLAASGELSYRKLLGEHPSEVNLGVLDYPDVLYFSAPIYQSPMPSDVLTDEALGAKQDSSADARQIGWVSVFMSKASTNERRNRILFIGSLLVLLSLAATALVAMRLSKSLSGYVRDIVGALDRVTQGQLDTHIAPLGGGELEALARGINTMTASLKSAQENLQERIDNATQVISYQASHDTLTGLVNRREFEARLDRALDSARQYGKEHALCFIDLDQFKIVNDTCGHNAGDELLRQVALQLRQKVREGDTLARIGGDEFTLLLENCTLDDAFHVATQLRETLQAFRFVWQDKVFAIGASVGLVAMTRNSESVATLLSQADSACYTAKDMGRNRAYIFSEDDEARNSRVGAMEWVTQISRALDEERFLLFCQRIKAVTPQGAEQYPLLPAPDSGAALHLAQGAERIKEPAQRIGADEAQRRHYEILLRMVGEKGEPILPMAFIPAAERFNQMQAVDRWVIRQSFNLLRQLLGFGERAPDVSFSINLSGASLCDDRFAQFLKEQFAFFAVPSGRVCFEITETAAITNLTQAINLIHEFKKFGCKFVLDDFGAGLSSFSYLKHLPVDGIKIDGAFVRGIARDTMDFSMVEAINKIGHVMGLWVTAEFVEDEQVFEKLRQIGIDFAQGNWVHRPVEVAVEFADLLGKRAERALKLVADNTGGPLKR